MLIKFITGLAWIIGSVVAFLMVFIFGSLYRGLTKERADKYSTTFWVLMIPGVPCWAWLLARYVL